MKKFILKIVFFLFPLLSMVLILNYTIDPANIFNQDYEKKMVEIIMTGKNVITTPNYNERAFMYLIIKAIKRRPKTIILGSSRTMLLNKETLKDNSLINASVSSAVIEDFIVIYEMFKANNILPEDKIIIGIDPWIFNDRNGEKRWVVYEKYYKKFFNENKEIKNKQTLSLYYELLSLSYFQNSIKSIKNVQLNFEPIPTSDKYNKDATILTDISHVYQEKVRCRNDEQISFLVKEYISNNMYRISNFKKPSKQLYNIFDLLIKDIRKQGIQVELFIEPYHPEVYKEIQINYPAVIETELLIKEYALKNQITIMGSFNPNTCNLNYKDFYDGMHCNDKGVRKIIKEYERTTHNIKNWADSIRYKRVSNN